MNAGNLLVTMQIQNANFNKQLNQVEKQINQTADVGSSAMDGMSKSSAISLGLISAAAAAAFSAVKNVVSSSIGDAVARFDTLNNSARTFANMGFNQSTITGTMDKLKTSILGLPTSLDEAVRGVTMFAGASGDLAKSQKIYKALNDGILGFGGSSDMVSNAILQFSQNMGLADVSAQTFNSMMNSGMGPALSAIAKKFGTTTGSLKDALGGLGSLSDIGIPGVVDKTAWLEDQLISLDENGGGGMKSLSQIAQDSTQGIGTSFANAGTAVTRGVADIIKAVNDSMPIADVIKGLGDTAESALKGFAGTIKDVINFINQNKDWLGPLTLGIGGAITAFGALNKAFAIGKDLGDVFGAISGGTKAIQKLNQETLLGAAAQKIAGAAMTTWGNITKVWSAITTAATVVMDALNVSMNANVFAVIVIAIAALVAGLIWFFTQTDIGKKIFQDFSNFIGQVFGVIGDVISNVGKFFGDVIQNIINFFTNLWDIITQVANVIGQVLSPIIEFIIGYFQVWWTVVSTIITIFMKVAEILWTLVIVAIQAVWNVIVAVFTPVAQFIGGVFGVVWNVISTVFGFIFEIIGGIVGFVVGVFTNVVNVIGGIIGGLIGIFSSVFGTISKVVGGIVDGIIGFFSGIGNTIGGFISAGFKTVVNGALGLLEGFLNTPINLINGAIDLINHLPGVHIGKITNIKLPRMAMGGITNGPMAAIIGEAGKEAVMPLENNTGWIDKLAGDIISRGGVNPGQNDEPQMARIVQNNTIRNDVDMDRANRDLFREGRRING